MYIFLEKPTCGGQRNLLSGHQLSVEFLHKQQTFWHVHAPSPFLCPWQTLLITPRTLSLARAGLCLGLPTVQHSGSHGQLAGISGSEESHLAH